MNRNFKLKELKDVLLPTKLDSFTDTGLQGYEKYLVEYDGQHFEGATMKSVINRVLKYIFVGGGDRQNEKI